jgi:hypothetical protein
LTRQDEHSLVQRFFKIHSHFWKKKEEIEMMRPNVPATLAGGRVRTLRHAEEQRSPVKKEDYFYRQDRKNIFNDSPLPSIINMKINEHEDFWPGFVAVYC